MTAPLKIRTPEDLAATAAAREALAIHCADVFAETYEDSVGDPSEGRTLSLVEVVHLTSSVLARVLLDEPATGEAVDVAGDCFRAAFHRHVWEELS